MKHSIPYILFLLLFLLCTGFALSPKQKVTVYLFLGEKCVISQYYTLPLRELHREFANDDVRFVGIFSNPDASKKGIQQFKEKYQIPFELQLDKTQAQMNQFEVKVTPEVVVVQENTKEVLYQGRIDNTYFKVGRRRQITTTAELKEALQAIQQQENIAIKKTTAVGCFISKTNPILRNAVMCKPTIPQQ